MFLSRIFYLFIDIDTFNDFQGIFTNIFEKVDLEFSKRIYDIQAKSDILKLFDDTEDKSLK